MDILDNDGKLKIKHMFMSLIWIIYECQSLRQDILEHDYVQYIKRKINCKIYLMMKICFIKECLYWNSLLINVKPSFWMNSKVQFVWFYYSIILFVKDPNINTLMSDLTTASTTFKSTHANIKVKADLTMIAFR